MTVETIKGEKLHGLAINQTLADMQLRTGDGRMHLLRKEGGRYREVTSQADWPSYDGKTDGNRYSTLKQIDRSNAARLVPKWIFSLNDTPNLPLFTRWPNAVRSSIVSS